VALVRWRPDGSAWIDRDDLSAATLAGIAASLDGLASLIAEARRQPDHAVATPGAECRYCRCAAACPEGPLVLAIRSSDGIARMAGSAHGRARLLALADFARQVPELIDQALRAAVASGDADLPDGKRLALESSSRAWVSDADRVHEAISALVSAEVADQQCPQVRHATLAGIDRAAKAAKMAGEKVPEAVRRIRQAVEAAGGIATRESDRVVVR
jgi:hypothetical protein